MINEGALNDIAKKMVLKGKGILAADESSPTCTKRLDSIGVESTFEMRNEYRDMLFSTNNLENFISGVILFDETFRQSTTCEKHELFIDLLNSKGIVPGIKVDTGAKNLAGFNGEKITEGLDGLRDRLKEYYDLGARFAKWRAVITIGDNMPSDGCILANAHALARYSALCQETGIVPIVEPEVLMDGDHTIETCYEISKRTLNVVFEQLLLNHVYLGGIVLKPNMIISALDCPEQASVEKVADMTFKCLKENVPAEVPGIAFLSGGQSSDLATAHLCKMNEKYSDQMPWNLTFSYGRALQHDALNAWGGSDRVAGQKALMERAEGNSLATYGKELTLQ
ncbi:MAG: fructose-bisphosphate aldolase class I [Candidatus Marinimicrobia bacterium]|jgi:fructose-bisphosphate aldolase class I|nr:fructose-bisphosphate aldolase class I [Candidatus Neomarinimicrobiota bacterium]|tara:strand:+ start:671 stop:1687 length:1017 start_codon:yes stop_codon:yes gene_type:complete